MRLYAPNPYSTRYIQDNNFKNDFNFGGTSCLKGELVRFARYWLIRVLVLFCPPVSSQPRPPRPLNSQTAPTRIRKEPDLVRPSQNTAKTPKKRQLNPQFTFSLFVEGRSNQMAAETCRQGFVTQLGASPAQSSVLSGPTGSR